MNHRIHWTRLLFHEKHTSKYTNRLPVRISRCSYATSTTRTNNDDNGRRRRSTIGTNVLLSPHHRTNLIFGANTDVGKTVITAGLVRASLLRQQEVQQRQPTHLNHSVHYIKPLQCGGSDQQFVEKYVQNILSSTTTTTTSFTAQTLFRWETPVSPHLACRIENKPMSDEQVQTKLRSAMQEVNALSSSSAASATATTTYIETAGGVLSPSSASKENNTHPQHVLSSMCSTKATTATTQNTQEDEKELKWGWTLQGDLYQSLLSVAPVILIGDGRLGGISCTISAMESILLRGYDIAAIIMLDPPSQNTTNYTNCSNTTIVENGGNIQAIREYITSRPIRNGYGDRILLHPNQSIVSLPAIPIDPNIPLYDWYESEQVLSTFAALESYIAQSYEDYVYDVRSAMHNNNNNIMKNPVWLPGSTDPSCHRMLVNCATNNTINIVTEQLPNGGNTQLSAGGTTPTATTTATEGQEEIQPLISQSITDASASWWTQGIAHGDSTMALAIAAVAGRYGHISGTPPASCMIHQPVLSLSQTLIRQNAPWARYALYTDDGGTSAVEIAIKMGLKTYQERMKLSVEDTNQITWIVGAQESCYHGDTLGAMNVMESYVSNEHPWYKERSYCVPTPTIGYQDGKLCIILPDGMTYSEDISYEFNSIRDIMDIHVRSISPKLLSLYKEMIEMQWLAHEHRTHTKIGCILFEPLLQCAGGMKFIDPLFQSAMMDVASSRSIPIIMDETSTGLYRLGIRTCHQLLLRDPDIVIYSKLLTGGVLPLSAIVTNRNVYDACTDVDFLYGNTFIANPLTCAGALHALSLYDAQYEELLRECDDPKGVMRKDTTQPYLLFDEVAVKQISTLPMVKQCFTLGSVLTITLNTEGQNGNTDGDDDSSSSNSANIASWIVHEMLHVHRTLIGINQISNIGDVIYLMVPPFTPRSECQRLTNILYQVLLQQQS